MVGVSVLAGSLLQQEAMACGPTPEEVVSLLPFDDAQSVPLNVVLQASSLLSQASFELIEVESGTTIPAAASCSGVADAYHCVGRPVQLRPDTEYAWHAFTDSEQATESQTRSFRTGSGVGSAQLGVDGWVVTVVRDESDVAVGCGIGRRVTVRVDPLGNGGPAVVSLLGMVPSVDQPRGRVGGTAADLPVVRSRRA